MLHRKNLKKNLQKTKKKSKKLLVKRYDEDSTRLLVTRLVILSNISFYYKRFTTMPFLPIPASSKPCIGYEEFGQENSKQKKDENM